MAEVVQGNGIPQSVMSNRVAFDEVWRKVELPDSGPSLQRFNPVSTTFPVRFLPTSAVGTRGTPRGETTTGVVSPRVPTCRDEPRGKVHHK